MDTINQILDSAVQSIDPNGLLSEEVKENMKKKMVEQIDEMVFMKCSAAMTEEQVNEFVEKAATFKDQVEKVQLLRSYVSDFDNLFVESVKDVIGEYVK